MTESSFDIKIAGQLVYSEDSQFIMSVYRRPTFKGAFANFESFISKFFEFF